MQIYDLQKQRAGALERVQGLIVQNEKTLAVLSRDNPRRVLIEVLVKRLKTQADKLRCGLVDRRNAAE